MSISMARFSSEAHFATYDPFRHEAPQVLMFQLQCRRCGYEPTGRDAILTVPGICPRCHGESWERFARPGSILKNAVRH